jgi:hypothetical protein
MYRVEGGGRGAGGRARLKETFGRPEIGVYFQERMCVDLTAVDWEDEVLLEVLRW